MPSILKRKTADLTPAQRKAGERVQWTPHQGSRERARHLRRLQAEALREQRAGCDWRIATQHVPAPTDPATGETP